MARNVQTIRIESILGGHSPMTHFAAPDQFQNSLGIDPLLPVDTSTNKIAGVIRPTKSSVVTGVTVNDPPIWIIPNPKTKVIYIADSQGSIYSMSRTVGTTTLAGISDGGNESGSSSGNGCAYYDNYMYFARNTTVARYGPLNGTPVLNGDYWGATLGKTALSDTTYPSAASISLEYPNHFLHRHSDGKLYIADVVDNQGTIHYIKTTKTSVEGDTDNGSTYDAVNVGYGLWPTAIESYGSFLVIAFYEGNTDSNELKSNPAKVAFWDTTSSSVNDITWVEYPDSLVGAIKNVNGILYFFSGTQGQVGTRVLKYLGGSSFDIIKTIDNAACPLPGAVASHGNRLFFGSSVETYPDSGSCVFALGLPGINDDGLFNIQRHLSGTGKCTSIIVPGWERFGFTAPVAGMTTGAQHFIYEGEDGTNSSYTTSIFWSQIYKIGRSFKITKIRIPLAQTITSNMIITPVIYTDDGVGTTYTGGTTSGLSIINNTNYNGLQVIVMRPQNLTGKNNFWLGLNWSGTILCTVSLPIEIEYELYDD